MAYWREFCILKWVGHGNKNRLKHSVHGLIDICEGFEIIGRIFLLLRFDALFYFSLFYFFKGGGGRGREGEAYYQNFTVFLFALRKDAKNP